MTTTRTREEAILFDQLHHTAKLIQETVPDYLSDDGLDYLQSAVELSHELLSAYHISEHNLPDALNRIEKLGRYFASDGISPELRKWLNYDQF